MYIVHQCTKYYLVESSYDVVAALFLHICDMMASSVLQADYVAPFSNKWPYYDDNVRDTTVVSQWAKVQCNAS